MNAAASKVSSELGLFKISFYRVEDEIIYCLQKVKYTALGARAKVLDRKIGAPCSSPDEVATQQTFSIFMPIMKAPPGGPGCHYKDPNATV